MLLIAISVAALASVSLLLLLSLCGFRRWSAPAAASASPAVAAKTREFQSVITLLMDDAITPARDSQLKGQMRALEKELKTLGLSGADITQLVESAPLPKKGNAK